MSFIDFNIIETKKLIEEQIKTLEEHCKAALTKKERDDILVKIYKKKTELKKLLKKR